MATDVDMGTPQISTLREEETPPPQPTKGKFRVNLLVGEKSASAGPSSKSVKPQAGESDDEEEEEHDELEEDQLIDDDDEAIQLKRPLSVTIPAPKPKPRKRARKSEKIEPKPAETVVEGWDPQQNASISDASPVKPPPKKKAAPKKPTAPKPKPKIAPKVVKSLSITQLVDDADAVSESNYAGTAASSPVPPDANSPEPELLAPSNAMPVDINFEGVALPIYPLPNKPYPVQPPPKIPTGFAPVIPLDKSTNKPRHWRMANREIRGIAGGRWFARTWVGDKESELTVAAANREAAAAIMKANVETDKRAGNGQGSISSRGGHELLSATSSLKVSPKPRTIKSQAGASVATSRAASIVSDAHAPRAPTKMRNILAGPASEADSDMVAPVS